MSAINTESSAGTVTLSGEERALLLNLLGQILHDKQIEEHRSETFDHAGVRSDSRALLDRPGPRSHIRVRDERHRRHAVGAMAALTAALQDRRDVLREGDVTGYRRA